MTQNAIQHCYPSQFIRVVSIVSYSSNENEVAASHESYRWLTQLMHALPNQDPSMTYTIEQWLSAEEEKWLLAKEEKWLTHHERLSKGHPPTSKPVIVRPPSLAALEEKTGSWTRSRNARRALAPFGATSALWKKVRPRDPTSSADDPIKTLREGEDVVVKDDEGGSLTAPFTSDSRPTTHQRLAAEVKGIYSDLEMIEPREVEVANALPGATKQVESSLNFRPRQEYDEYCVHGLGRSKFPFTTQAPWQFPRRKELPMLIEDIKEIACYDTRAEANFMTESLAARQGLTLQTGPNDRLPFTLANGKKVTTLGKVESWCTFALDPREKIKCAFQVLTKLPRRDLIMGRAFLSMTQTLTYFHHRLQACTADFALPSINLLESGTQEFCTRLACYVGRQLIYINPDTGSDIDVMSLKFASNQRYNINENMRRMVRLGDCSVAMTCGQVQARIDVDDSSYWKTFDVLPNLTSDIILGELTLEEIEAYTEHEDNFVEVDCGARLLDMNPIVALHRLGTFFNRMSKRREDVAVDVPDGKSFLSILKDRSNAESKVDINEQQDNEDLREILRRDEQKAKIRAMSDNDPNKSAMQRHEKDRRVEYERSREEKRRHNFIDRVPLASTQEGRSVNEG